MELKASGIASCLLTAFVAVSIAGSAQAHPDPRSHVHVGGGLSTKPYTFTLQTWYRDIVYDDSAPDTQFTSLDVYTAMKPEPKSPVMVFVHGGGLRVGDKASSKDLDPKPEFFVSKLGYVLVSVNYRLLPEGAYPRNAQDVANSLAWVHNNIAEYGGDPDRIFLMGHSAGASLVAIVSTDDRFLKNAGKDLTVLKGVIANEGGYGVVEEGEDEASLKGRFGEKWQENIPLAQAKAGKNIPPYLLIHVTGGDTLVEGSEAEAQAFAAALRDAGVRTEVLSLDHVEHFGANETLGEGGEITTVTTERFLDSITGRKEPAVWQSAR